MRDATSVHDVGTLRPRFSSERQSDSRGISRNGPAGVLRANPRRVNANAPPRHLMMDSLLLLLATTFIIVSINRLVLGWLKLVYSLLHLLLVTDGFKALAMTGLLGLGVVVAELRGDRPMRLGRLAVSAGLAGVFVSSLAWFLLSWQQEDSYDCQADYLLDNIQLNAEQVMVSRLSLMRRMADRLDAGGGEIDPALLRWNPTVRGYVSPEVFIPLAESTGQIISQLLGAGARLRRHGRAGSTGSRQGESGGQSVATAVSSTELSCHPRPDASAVGADG